MKKSWREILPVHPAAEMFPLMSEPELRELGEDIKKNGLRVSLALWRDDLKKLSLLDGRNRLDAMELVGVPFRLERKKDDFSLTGPVLNGVPLLDVSPNKESDPYKFVLSANIHRRHLTADQKRELIAKVLKAKPETSNNAIAKQVKADDKTVAKVRREMEATSEIPKLDKTVGADGKARKAPAPRGSSRERFKQHGAKKPAAVTEPIMAMDNGDEPEGNAGSKKPFRDLKTGEIVMRYRGRAGYVPVEESEGRIAHIARVTGKLIEGNINLARELRDILRRTSEFLGKDFENCCACCLLNCLTAHIKSEEQTESIVDRPTTATPAIETPPKDDGLDLPACLRREPAAAASQ
jgi:hypothetical protein